MVKKTLNITHPHLLKEWCYDKNKITPNQITRGSGQKAWWKCSKCNEIYEQRISNKAIYHQKCPYCCNKKINKKNSLKTKYPKIAKQWDFKKNKQTPDKIAPRSKKKFWWICNKCKKSYHQPIANKTAKNCGCPYCGKRKISKETSLQYKYKKLSASWSKKNKKKSYEVFPNSHKKGIWSCPSCKVEFIMRISDAVKRFEKGITNCQSCSPSGISHLEKMWLNSLGIPDTPQTRSVRIEANGKTYRADGFDPLTNTIYEFNGDFWHGNPNKYNPKDINKVKKITFGELYRKTLEKEANLKSAGFKLINIWEDDFVKNMNNI